MGNFPESISIQSRRMLGSEIDENAVVTVSGQDMTDPRSNFYQILFFKKASISVIQEVTQKTHLQRTAGISCILPKLRIAIYVTPQMNTKQF